MNKFMRVLVFFDLPVKTPSQRSKAARFRNFLLSDGYFMVQYSVYARICNGTDAVSKHKARLKAHLPDDGAVRMLVVTEKQYGSIEILLGRPSPAEEDVSFEQLTIF